MSDRKESENKKKAVFVESKGEIVTTMGSVRSIVGPLISGTCLVTTGDGTKPGSFAASRPRGRAGGGGGVGILLKKFFPQGILRQRFLWEFFSKVLR